MKCIIEVRDVIENKINYHSIYFPTSKDKLKKIKQMNKLSSSEKNNNLNSEVIVLSNNDIDSLNNNTDIFSLEKNINSINLTNNNNSNINNINNNTNKLSEYHDEYTRRSPSPDEDIYTVPTSFTKERGDYTNLINLNPRVTIDNRRKIRTNSLLYYDDDFSDDEEGDLIKQRLSLKSGLSTPTTLNKPSPFIFSSSPSNKQFSSPSSLNSNNTNQIRFSNKHEINKFKTANNNYYDKDKDVQIYNVLIQDYDFNCKIIHANIGDIINFSLSNDTPFHAEHILEGNII
jgi:hypothetical protein